MKLLVDSREVQTSVIGSMKKHALTEQFNRVLCIYVVCELRLTEPGEELVQCSMHSVKNFNLFEFGIFTVEKPTMVYVY